MLAYVINICRQEPSIHRTMTSCYACEQRKSRPAGLHAKPEAAACAKQWWEAQHFAVGCTQNKGTQERQCTCTCVQTSACTQVQQVQAACTSQQAEQLSNTHSGGPSACLKALVTGSLTVVSALPIAFSFMLSTLVGLNTVPLEMASCSPPTETGAPP